MRVAIVRLTAMGDVIHTLASVQFIKAQRPDIELAWFVEEKFAGILANNPHIDRIVPLNLHGLKKAFSLEALGKVRERIKKAGPFDLVVDVQGLLKSALVAKTAGKTTAGLDYDSAKEGAASLLYTRRYRVDCAGVAPMRFASLLAQALGVMIDEEAMAQKTPYLFADESRVDPAVDDFFDTTRKNLLLVTAASNASKTYPADKWAEVVRRLKKHNVLLVAGSDAERQEARKIAKTSHAALLPPMDLNTLKHAVGRCDLLIGGDTGPSHLAWAMNRPSVLLFGSTPKSMMFETPINVA
ncbi:lipopolysaccharide heptosyltransferase I, partial [Hydrogenimonas sp.]